MLTLRAAALVCAAIASHLDAQQSRCNEAAAKPIITVAVPGSPFQALPTEDGCWVFVSLPGGGTGTPGQLAVLRRSRGSLTLARTIRIGGNPTGMALTHNGRLLLVASGPRLAFVDPSRLIAGQSNAVLGYLDEPGQLGRIYVNVTVDDKFAFVADERAQTISVIDLAKARATRYDASSIVGKIPTGRSPIAVTFSADNTLMFVTSQAAPANLGWPIECKRESGAPADTTPVNPQGAIHIIDVTRATTDPAQSVLGSVPAGCSAVRLVLSPNGGRAYVSARNNNALLAFDTAKLRSDPANAMIGRVPVGTAPVGIAVIDGGRKIVVTNSNRFAGTSADHQMLTVVDAARINDGAAAVLGSIPAGAFPREMRVTADGRTLLLTNFGSGSVQMIDVTRLPIEPVAP